LISDAAEVPASSPSEAQFRAHFILPQHVPLGPGSNISASPPIRQLVLDYLADLGDAFVMLKGDNLALSRNRIKGLLRQRRKLLVFVQNGNLRSQNNHVSCFGRLMRNSPRGLPLCIYTVPRTHDLTACRLRCGITTRRPLHFSRPCERNLFSDWFKQTPYATI
jgi:hypothetical protein